jgi:short-subunit dehydrogenase
MVKKLMPLMTNRVGKQFGLINVSSGTGFYPQPYATTYSATKAFVN